jgi:hypothetical protein
MSTPADDPQPSFDEREVNDPDLESLLSDREIAKGKKGEAVKKFRTLDDLAKEKIAELDLSDDDVVRIGRFRVTSKSIPSRAVSFETEPTTRLNIGVAEDS